jgi:hypothetical protein
MFCPGTFQIRATILQRSGSAAVTILLSTAASPATFSVLLLASRSLQYQFVLVTDEAARGILAE